MLAQHSAFAKEGETRERREGIEHAEERLEVALVATSKARDETKTAKKKALMSEGNKIAKVGRRWHEVGKLIKQLQQLVAAGAVLSK